ncbi:MAG: NTP transferase domain-containing protein, partial [Candidatus Methylomirabilales bacterium]
MHDVCAVIVAAGEGTRMRSQLPKVLHPVLGRPLISYPVDLCLGLGVKRVLLVVGPRAEGVRQALAGRPVEFVE